MTARAAVVEASQGGYCWEIYLDGGTIYQTRQPYKSAEAARLACGKMIAALWEGIELEEE